ncbi:unnamed protein product [Vitrella brassicaformis CCMP3155]|uniref:Endonuclease III homolog n=1 Tax=Vitrella brassicaformis (strain CCMP3155) TaxID=1169540 RepID=A0A0G4F4B0_VITBC|nr:unnamed protein product [Vitrella brassicaformis CCMP3155]|eukprot:CEM07119.1 unnamed protein product [Vitrella brassicaformis CCMP3155]
MAERYPLRHRSTSLSLLAASTEGAQASADVPADQLMDDADDNAPLQRAYRSKIKVKASVRGQSAAVDMEGQVDDGDVGGGEVPSRVSVKRKRRQRVAVSYEDGEGERQTVAPPDNFEEIWDGVSEMRKARNAPVDHFGIECCGDRSQPPPIWRFQTLIAAMLSSQTKDEHVAACMNRLKAHGLTVENILATPDDALKELLYGVGFHNNKAKYIRQVCEILQRDYGSDIPSTTEGLVALVGVGPKMAHIILQACFDKSDGIAVDIHVHRIANRLRWVKTKTPAQTQSALESWVPTEKWREINPLLVGFGQQICLPVGPRCVECLIRPLCPEGRRLKGAPVTEGNGGIGTAADDNGVYRGRSKNEPLRLSKGDE